MKALLAWQKGAIALLVIGTGLLIDHSALSVPTRKAYCTYFEPREGIRSDEPPMIIHDYKCQIAANGDRVRVIYWSTGRSPNTVFFGTTNVKLDHLNVSVSGYEKTQICFRWGNVYATRMLCYKYLE